MPHSPTLTAAQLLAPLSAEEFFRTYWERAHLVLARNQPGFYDAVLTLEDLDRHFQSTQLPAEYVLMYDKGVPIPASRWARYDQLFNGSALQVVVPEQLLETYAAGATIIVNSTQNSLPPMIEFCGSLAREWNLQTTQANLYLTPPNAQGFTAHYDRHCVFVMQVYGEKTWRIYEMGAEHPVESKTKLFKEKVTPGKLLQELVLRPGDLLYLPRGLVHEACTSSSASLHITLGMFPKFPFDLVRELGGRALRVPELRRGVAFGPGCEASRKALGEQLAKWVAGIDIAALPEECLASLQAKQPHSRRQRFSDVVQAPLITADSLIARRPEVAFTSERQGDNLIITVRERTVSAPGLAEPALKWLDRQEPFTPKDLPVLLLPKRKVNFVAELVKVGLLRIERL